jgi:hypothetical protein
MEIYDNDTLIQTIKSFPFEKCRLCRDDVVKNIYIEWNKYIITNYTNITNTTNITNNTFFDKIARTDINGRQLELSLPILLIAKIINEDLFEQLLELFDFINKEKQKEELNESIDVSVIEFVSEQVNSSGWIPLKELLRTFKGSIQNEEEWLNERWFGKALKRLNLIKDKKKMNYGRVLILNVEKAQEKIKAFR